jgi:alpha-1,2-mannosyltransferase
VRPVLSSPPSAERISRAGLWRALRLAATAIFFSLLPLFVLALVVIWASGFDFQVFWTAGHAVLSGQNPYPPLTHAALASEHVFVYPPQTALLMVPLALVPLGVATILFDLLLAAALIGALRLAGVSDWRCYGLVFASAPVFNALGVGAVSPLLALGVALAWRYRDRAYVCGLCVAALVVAKVFLWPLLVWLLLSRRHRALVVAVFAGLVSTVCAWAAIGFAGLHDYPQLLLRLGDIVGWKSYSLSAFALAVGLPGFVAKAVAWAALCGALTLAYRLRKRADGDLLVLTATLGAAFLCSPIVWPHYLVILLVPLAVRHPRLSVAWLLPLLMWPTPLQSFGVFWCCALGLGLQVALLLSVSTRADYRRWLQRWQPARLSWPTLRA